MDQAIRIATTPGIAVDLSARPRVQTHDELSARSPDNSVRFRRVSGRSGLMSIERVWRRITAQREAVRHYQSYDWYNVYLDALEYHENDWHFFIVYQDYTPVGIVPLRHSQATVHGVRLQALELPDHPHVPFADLIVPELPTGHFTASFLNYLRHSGAAWDALILRRIAADSPTLRLFASNAALTCVAASHRRTLSSVQATEAKGDRQAHEQLAQLGHLEYAGYHHKAALYASFASFLRVEASGWQGHAGLRGAIRDHSRLVRYYRRLIDIFGDGGCEIGLLKLNGQPIAAQFCLLSNGTRYVLKTAYDAPYAHLGATCVLLGASIRHSTSDDPGFHWVAAAPWNYPESESCATFDIHRFNTTRRGLSAYARMQIGQTLDPVYQDYRRLRHTARGRARDGIAHVSRAMDQHMRCP